MKYVKTNLKEEISITKIISVHYFEYAKDYIFEGEKHDFWEFLYVDKGEVEIMSDMNGYKLKQGEIIFHKPNEFHNVWANGKVAPNLIVISFECKSLNIKYFENKILHFDDFEKNLLAQIIKEAKEAFSSPLNITSLEQLEKRPNQLFGCEQLLKIYLEHLLINMIRRGSNVNKETKLSTSVKERSDDDLIKKIKLYLEENVCSNITFDDVCKFSCLSRTYLKVIFKKKTDLSIMEYFKKLKIDEAKRIIREGNYNFTEIAELLGYASIHYFSRNFKKATGMNPSQYATSVQIKT